MLSPAASLGVLAVLRSDERPPPAGTDLARFEEGARLARAALQRELLQVPLADGSALPLDDAERLLSAKEERRPHRALRSAVDGALAELRQFRGCRYDDASAHETGEAFLRDTADLAEAALEALERLTGVALEDEHALAWALDLPSPAFEVARALELLAAVRASIELPLPSVRVPRALAGVVLHEGVAKLGIFPRGARAARWGRLVEGGAVVAAASCGIDTVVGRAFALGAMTPPVLTRIGLGRDVAERAARIAAVRALVGVRACVALANRAWEEAVALLTTRSVRPSAALRELVDPTALGEDPRAAADDQLGAAAAALALRDAWDEGFVLERRAWQEPIAPPGGSAASSWRAWVGPWL